MTYLQLLTPRLGVVRYSSNSFWLLLVSKELYASMCTSQGVSWEKAALDPVFSKCFGRSHEGRGARWNGRDQWYGDTYPSLPMSDPEGSLRSLPQGELHGTSLPFSLGTRPWCFPPSQHARSFVAGRTGWWSKTNSKTQGAEEDH